MKKKRWLALAMGTLMAVSVTACGSSQAVETKAGSEDAEYAEFKTYIYELKTRTG